MKLLIILFISVIIIHPQTDIVKKYKYMYERRQQTTPEIGGYSLNSSATNQYIAVDYNTYIFGQTAFTYEAWFNASTFSPAFELGNRYITNQRSWRYSVEATRFRINFSTDGTGSTTSTVNINYNFNTNTNYHLIIVYDGTVCSLYVNGSFVNSGAISGVIYDGNALLKIGLTTAGSTYAVGKIYLVRYYGNDQIDATKAATLYNNGRPDLIDGKDVNERCYIELKPDKAGLIGWVNTAKYDAQWYPTHHAYTVNNPQRLTTNNQIIYDCKTNITGNTTLPNVVPAGYMIKEIILLTMGGYFLNVSGISSGGADVLNNYGCSEITIISDINIFISTIDTKSLYLQSNDWNGSTSSISIKMEKIN